MLRTAAFLFALISLLPLPAQAGVDGVSIEALRSGSTVRSYRLFVPPGWSRQKHRAALIVLHGGGSNAATMARYTGLDDKAASAGFLVAYPEGTALLPRVRTWNAGTCCGPAARREVDDVGFLRDLAAELIRQHGVDPARMHFTGLSNGAMMAYRMAAEAPDMVASVAAVSGTLAIDPVHVQNAVPVLHIHGSADSFVPWDGGIGEDSMAGVAHRSVHETIQTWVRANQAGPAAETTLLPDVANDGLRVQRSRYRSRHDAEAVVLYRIEGGGHVWPGRSHHQRRLGKVARDIDANDLIWDFFERHPRSRERNALSGRLP